MLGALAFNSLEIFDKDKQQRELKEYCSKSKTTMGIREDTLLFLFLTNPEEANTVANGIK